MSTLEVLTVEKKLPVFTVDISSHAQVIEAAKLAIQQEQERDPVSMDSNVKAKYVSGWSSHIFNANFMPLVNLTLSCVKFISRDYFKVDLDFMCYNCWGAHYGPGDYTHRHYHYPSDFAAVAYLEVADGAAPIIFEDTLKITPKTGTLLVFPGILYHEVPKTTAERLVVAMNIDRKEEK